MHGLAVRRGSAHHVVPRVTATVVLALVPLAVMDAPAAGSVERTGPGAAAEPGGADGRRCRPIVDVEGADLGDLGGDSGTTAMALNNRAQVVGVSDTPTDDEHAFLWQRGVMTDLTPSLRGYSIAVDVNNRGQVLLRWTESDTGREGVILRSPRGGDIAIDSNHPQALNDRGQVLFNADSLWDDGTVTTIPPPRDGLEAVSTHLGEGGHVAGTLWRIPEPGEGHPPAVGAFVWEDGTSTELDIRPYSIGEVLDVDRRGRVLLRVGRSGGPPAVLLWDDGQYVELGSLGGPTAGTWATDMNDRGQVVGWSVTASGDEHAFLWDDGEMIDLDGVAGRQSRATSINDRGQIGGWSAASRDPFEPQRGVVWWCGEMFDLGSAGPPGPGQINARGQWIGSWPAPTSAPYDALYTPVWRR